MVRFVNFRASDIQPNPDEVMYWVDLNTDPLGGSIKVWNAEGYWETIKVLQGTIPEFENRIKKWVEQQLKNFDEHLNEEIRQFDGRIAIISQDIETLKLTKQDKLIAGSGIDITDNVVSCVLDLTLYKIVSELPTEDIDTTKIYLVVDSEGTHGNLYKEYIYVDGEWELLGEYKADIDLSPYLTKVEAADTYATKLELQQEVNRATQAEVTEKNRALAAEEQLSKDIDAEKDRALIAERDNFNRIINEIARAEAAEKANAKAIEDEAKRAIEIETALASGMVEEQNRAIEAEEQLQDEIWAVDAKMSEQGGSLTDAINSNTQAIADETARATQAEDNNRNLINAMDTAYKAADTATNTKLDNEIIRAKAAEKTNADAIVVEADRNDAQDTLISNLQSSKVSTVNLVQDPDNELHYTLMVDSTNAGEISIPKDRFLKQAYYDPQKKSLIFIFVTEDGEQTVPVDISDLVDTYTAGNGLSLADNKFSITIDSTSDSYLTVGANGIKLSGVAAAINKLDTDYLRYRGNVNSSSSDKDPLKGKIGIMQYNATLPTGLSGPYDYGAVVSLPAESARLELYYSHHSSNGAYADPTKTGMYYRTGWDNDLSWTRIVDYNNVSETNVANKIPVRDANKQILTSGYKKEGSSAVYLLTGDGGHIAKQVEAVASTVVQRDGSGTIYAKTFVTSLGDEETSIGSVFIRNTTDNSLRRVSFANFKSALNIPSAYTLPTASSTTLGGIKVGAGLSISNGVLSANGGGTADSVAWANVTGKPTWIGTAKPTYRLDEIASSTNQTVDASTTPVSRKKIVYVGKSGNGWISAVALGIRNVNGSFGPAVLSLGTKDTPSDTAAIDDGWVDYQFQTSGRIASKAGTFAVTSDIPTSLKNPNAIKFTGAVTGTYDGSSAVTLNIPTIAGPKGDTGDQGPRGYAGSDGANGKSLEFVWSGYTLGVRQEGTTSYTYSTSLRGATGAKGDKGDKGDTGPAGTTTWSGITGKPSWIGSSKPSYSYSEISGTPSLADVATSGLYNDLSNKPVIDTALSSTSTNAVQNKVIYEQLVKKAEIVGYQAGQNGYIKFDNGLLMQWGYKTASSTGTNTTYTPIAFYNATYCPIITYREPGQGMNIVIGLVTLVQNSYFTIRSRYAVGDSNGTGAGINDFYWVAVGRWK